MPSNTNALNYRQQQYSDHKQQPKKNVRKRSTYSKYNRASTTPRKNPSFNSCHVAIATMLVSSLLLSSYVAEAKTNSNTDLACSSTSLSQLTHNSSIKTRNPMPAYTVGSRIPVMASEQTIKPTLAYTVTNKPSVYDIDYNQKTTSTTIAKIDSNWQRQPICSSTSKIGLCYQPPLQKDIIKEADLFLQLLQPYSKLPEDEKAASTLLMIQDRVASFATFGYDIDTEGRAEFWANVPHILADQAQGMDCEDFATLHKFYAEIAQEYNFLPKNAIFGLFSMTKYHIVFLYTFIKKDRKEAYVIDRVPRKYFYNIKRLPTLKEYIKDHSKIFLELVYRNRKYTSKNSLSNIVVNYNQGHNAIPSLVDSGNIDLIHIALNSDTIETLVKSDDCDLFKNFRLNKFFKQQKAQLIQLPEDKDDPSFRDRINALQKKDHLNAWKGETYGAYIESQAFHDKPKTYISAKDLKITKAEAAFLIGKFSRGLNRVITEKDLL